LGNSYRKLGVQDLAATTDAVRKANGAVDVAGASTVADKPAEQDHWWKFWN
jgi:hypothetical protein